MKYLVHGKLFEDLKPAVDHLGYVMQLQTVRINTGIIPEHFWRQLSDYDGQQDFRLELQAKNRNFIWEIKIQNE